jgi:two-component system CheB/CheR fusion protein
MTSPQDTEPQPPPAPVTPEAPPSDERVNAQRCLVVGIGASAGGLEPLKALLGAIPAQSGMAFIVVQHLNPAHPSQLAAILGESTPLAVCEAVDGAMVLPDHVYVIPPGAALSISGGALRLQAREALPAPRFTIEHFFRSLAEERQSRAIGVLLSGNNADGARGLCEIKAAGGITFAQSAETAQFAAMPSAAVDAGCVDFVLPPAEIGARIASMRHHPYLAPAESVPVPEDVETLYARALVALRSATGVDFRLYRETTITRRIVRRMALLGEQHFADYVSQLEADPREAGLLHDDLLIHVTSFFREPGAFLALKQQVFPRLVRDRPPTDPLRVWVPGCSTGQEAYSLAMALVEFMEETGIHLPVQIFATDLSDATLARARAGLYVEGLEAELTPVQLRRFFHKEEHGYRIDKALRDMCVFARQDVTADPPFSHLDLISCRNVLIYFSPALQRRVLPTFHYALDAAGFLLLGPSETVAEGAELFEVVDRVHKIFAKKPSAVRPPLLFPAAGLRASLQRSLHGRGKREAQPAAQDIHRAADRVLLERYAPPGVLVSGSLDVLQFRGRTGDFLEAPPGEPTMQLLKLLRDGLFLEVRSALAEASSSGQPVVRDGVRMRRGEQTVQVRLEVLPVAAEPGAAPTFAVTFQASPPTGDLPPGPETPEQGAESAREMTHLRQQLAAMQEYVQSLVEQQDTSGEELRSANEEILSSNEELQSTNEELETAKEELQSSNEELTTVNEQLQRRNAELSVANGDLLNLLSSTNIPVVMVGADLRVRRFTAPASKALGLLPGDIGRPITDVRPAMLLPDFDAVIRRVIESAQPFEQEVLDRDGRWFLLRLHPYLVGDHAVDGAVIVLVDIEQRKRAELVLQEGRQKDVFLAMLAHELRNPLAPIRHAVDMLRLGQADPGVVTVAADVLERQVRQLARIIEDLVDVSRITERKIKLRREAVLLSSLVETAVQTCRPAIEAVGHRLSVVLPPEPLVLDADPVRLGQVFSNLLGNAAKFTEPGGRLDVEAHRVDAEGTAAPDGAFVAVLVRDDGMGIEPALLPRVFDLFTQGEQSLERSRGGLGIGLAVARSLVQMHGGTLEAFSEGPGKGTTFSVRLPLADRAPERAPDVPPSRAGRRRVLVVDDNRDQATALATLIGLMGHDVRTAVDGLAGLQAAREFRPDVALLDIGLPGMDGYVLAQQLRAMPELAHIVLVAQTGWGQDEDRRRSERAGFDHHLVKPVELGTLRTILDATRNAPAPG